MEATHPLKQWRNGKGLGQAEFGDSVGVSASQVSQIESGTKGCSLEVALKIRDVTNGEVPLESLVPRVREAAE